MGESHLSKLKPREWVRELPSQRYLDNPNILSPQCWRLKDKRRDWAVIHYLPSVQEWIAITLPGNGKHEYTGTFKDIDEAKVAVEARLTPDYMRVPLIDAEEGDF